ALAFFLHPLLDTVIFRPMPDMAEGALIGVAVVGWIALAEAERFRTRLLLSLGIGIVAAVLFSNRFTGLFVYPVLAAVALVTLWKNPRLSWKQAALHFGIIVLTGAALFCVEGLIYRQITGDFLHS